LASSHGGIGKSIIFGALMGAHVAQGVPFFGLRVEQGRVLFVSLEDPAEVVRERLHHVVIAYGLDPEIVAKNFSIVAPPPDGDPVLMEETSEFGTRQLRATATMEELEAIAADYSLIIADNASDAYSGNENDRPCVRAFLRRLARIAEANDAGFVLLGHVDKAAARFGGAGNSYAGSTAWNNTPRSRCMLIEKNNLVELHQEKLNIGSRKLAEPLLFRWSDTDSTFMPAGSGDSVAESSAAADQVLQAIRLAAIRGVEVKAARSGPATTQRILETLDLPATLRGPRGRDAFWAAIGHLHSTNKIEERDSWTASRHRCRVIVETGAPPIAAQYPIPRYAEPAKPAKAGSQAAVIASSNEPAQTRETREAAKYRAASEGEGP
jgi:hypothetical protein